MKNILVLLVVGLLVAIGIYGANTGVKHDHTKDSWRYVEKSKWYNSHMAWEDKSKWIINCPICYCAVTHQFYDYHLQYHKLETDAIRYYTELMNQAKESQ